MINRRANVFNWWEPMRFVLTCQASMFKTEYWKNIKKVFIWVLKIKDIWVWSDMRVTKWCNNFWVNYPSLFFICPSLPLVLPLFRFTDCRHYNTTFQLFLITCVCVHWCTINSVQTTEKIMFVSSSQITSDQSGGKRSFCPSHLSVAQMSQCALVSVFPEALPLSVDTVACSALTSW